MNSSAKIALIALCAILGGCSTINSSPYKASTSNVISIQQALAPSETQLNVGTFRLAAGVDSNPTCQQSRRWQSLTGHQAHLLSLV